MKAISKKQVIELFSFIRVYEGYKKYVVDSFINPVKPGWWYDCEDSRCEDLQPGTYCALYVDDTECSNIPSIGNWINEELEKDSIQVLPVLDSSKWVIIICLDLF